jgi:hypothetical protein
MENQMKICFITFEQYTKIYNKFVPQDRIVVGLTTLHLMSHKHNTLFIIGKQEDFIEEVKDLVRADWLE